MFFLIFNFFNLFGFSTHYENIIQEGKQLEVTLDDAFLVKNCFIYNIQGATALKVNDIWYGCLASIYECTFSHISGSTKVVFSFGACAFLDLSKNCINDIEATEEGAILTTPNGFNPNKDGDHKIHYLSATKANGNGPILHVKTLDIANNFDLKYSNITNMRNTGGPGLIKVEDFYYDIYQCSFHNLESTNAVLYLVNGINKTINNIQYIPAIHQSNIIDCSERSSGIINVQDGSAEFYEIAFLRNSGLRSYMIYSSADNVLVHSIYCEDNKIIITDKIGYSHRTSSPFLIQPELLDFKSTEAIFFKLKI